jgi:hypothetical protein
MWGTFSVSTICPGMREQWLDRLDATECRDTDEIQKPIKLTDLEYLGKEKQLDEDGNKKYILVRDTVNEAIVKWSGSLDDLYLNYDDWDESMRTSDQFEWPMQRLYQKKFKPGEWRMGNQESADVTQMSLAPLDIEKDILDDFTVLLVGRRRSGKTWIARWLMYHLRKRFSCGVVITGTKLNHFWQKHVPAEFIHDIEDMELVLRTIYKRQEWILEHPELGLDPRIFIILDDVLSEKYMVRFNKFLSKAFTDGRHHKIFTLITSQDPKGVPPMLRENADLCIMFRQFQKSRKKCCVEEYLDYIDDPGKRETFLWKWSGIVDKKGEYSEKENNPHIALAILQAKLTDDLQKIFKVVISEDPGDFMLGDWRYWSAMESGLWRGLGSVFVRMDKKKAKKKKQYEESDSEDAKTPKIQNKRRVP